MKIRMFKDVEEGEISPDHPIVVNLEEALKELQKFPPHSTTPDFLTVSMIGFQSPWNGLCFLRDEEETWKVMLLYKENNASDWDCSDREFTTVEVVEIVKAFFDDNSKWEKLCGVYRLSIIKRIWFNVLALYHSRQLENEIK